MEHYLIFGLAALVFGSLLFTIGPRTTQKSNNSYSPPYSEKDFKSKNGDR